MHVDKNDRERAAQNEKLALLSGSHDVEHQERTAISSSKEPGGNSTPKSFAFGMGLTTLIILYYATCSSLMLVINKLAIHNLPCPTTILCLQLLTSALTVWFGNFMGFLEADALEAGKLKRFAWVVVSFLGTVFANIKVLQNANVETFITFRSSTPLVLSVCDYVFLGRALPSVRSWVSLITLLMGSIGYVLVDSSFKISAYFWLLLWYFFFTFDTVYVKHTVETVKMTNWGRVYYTNAMALIPLSLSLPFLGEPARLATVEWSPQVLLPLVLSCAMGVGMSHSAYLLREAVSATMFTIVGILCKIVTVVINVLIWDKHATPAGICFLLVCVLAGTFYEQAPKRSSSN